jgi:hypothetical protein
MRLRWRQSDGAKPDQPAPLDPPTVGDPSTGEGFRSFREAYEAGFRPRKIPRSRRRYDPNAPKLRGEQMQAAYWQRQAEQQRAAAEAKAALERARAEREAGIQSGSESTVSWRAGTVRGTRATFLHRDF